MGVVEDHDVERLVDGRGVAEVLEEDARPAADDLAEVLGERFRAGDVDRPQSD